MRAAVVRAFDAPISMEDVHIEAPGPGEVCVRVAVAAVCHSDIHYMRGERAVIPPFIVGHELSGHISDVGRGVKALREGDAVAVSLVRSCGKCAFCLWGEPFHCEFDFALNHESRVFSRDGEALTDAGLGVSGFAEYAVVHESQAVPIPPDMPMDQAALLGCGVVTGAGAVINTARVRPGESVVVIGCGGVGLNAVQGARIVGASPIIAIDLRSRKTRAALQFGATAAVEVDDDSVSRVRALTHGRGADYVFVTAGSTAAAELALSLMRVGGCLVLVGLPGPEALLQFVMRDVGWAGQRIMGSTMGSTNLHVDIPRYIDFWREGRLELGALISGRFPLERLDEAVAAVERGEVLRNVIVFQ